MSDDLESKKKLLLKYSGGIASEYYTGITYRDIIRASIELRYGVVADVIIEINEGSYQGDTLIIAKDQKDRYYYYTYGWGSCSGCDQLQANEGTEEKMVGDYTPTQLKDAEDTANYMVKELVANSWHDTLIRSGMHEFIEYLKKRDYGEMELKKVQEILQKDG